MVVRQPFTFAIGVGDWVDEILTLTGKINPSYWKDFRPVTGAEITNVEQQVKRHLPADFQLFWQTFGCGSFPEPFGGNIYTPEDVCIACHGPLLMKLGSAEWASEEDQRHFYRSRGGFNPAPKKFTARAVVLEDVNLLDLLQVGTDGCCCYHQLFVGLQPGPFGYCLLTADVIEDRAASFSEGLRLVLAKHWRWHHGLKE
jgi:hypothetical protein